MTRTFPISNPSSSNTTTLTSNSTSASASTSNSAPARTSSPPPKFTPAQRDLYTAVLNVQRSIVSLCRESAGHSLDKLHSIAEDALRHELSALGFQVQGKVCRSFSLACYQRLFYLLVYRQLLYLSLLNHLLPFHLIQLVHLQLGRCRARLIDREPSVTKRRS